MNDDYPTLQERLESLSKALESRGRIDEQDHPYAYATILDAMKIEARYRWLRDCSRGQWEHPIVVSQARSDVGMNYIGPIAGKELDDAIDKAKQCQS